MSASHTKRSTAPVAVKKLCCLIGLASAGFAHQLSAETLDGLSTALKQDIESKNLVLRCEPRDEHWHCDKLDANTGHLYANTESDGLIAYDWVNADQLDEDQRKALHPGCNGMYFDPTLAIAEELGSDIDVNNLPLIIEADKSTVSQNETAELAGNVQVTQGARLIGADLMSYNLNTDIATLSNNVTIRNPGVLIRGSDAEVSATDYKASFSNAMFVLHEAHLRGGASVIRQTSPKALELEDGVFTSCEPGSSAWVLEGEKFSINTETNQGKARNVKLKLGSVPVLYFPYLSFPVGDERQSGFLFPSISVSDTSGVDIAQPYYLNLATNYDMTIVPRYIAKRGAMLELEGRHLGSQYSTVGNFAFLPNDRGGLDPDVERLINEGAITEEQAVPFKGKDRWLANIDQTGGLASRAWYTNIDFTSVSDVDYFRDLGTTSFSAQNTTHLNQSLSAGYNFDNWRLSTLLQDYQVLLYDVDDPYQRLPQINFDGDYRAGNVGLKLKNEYTHFDHQESEWSDGSTIVKGARLNTDYRLYWNNRAPWGFFVPEVGYQTLSYNLESDTISDNAETSPRLAAGQGSLDMGLIFENPGGSMLQTIEPRIFYLYRDYQDHSELFNVTDDGQFVNFDTSNRIFSYSQLYRDSRFAGRDRLDDANRYTIGLTTRWFSNASGRELFTASFGQIFYNGDRRVGLRTDIETTETSELAGDVRLSLSELTSLYASAIYDEENSEFIRGSGGVSFASKNYRNLATLSYTYVKDKDELTDSLAGGIDQADLSFLTPLSKKWYVMGRSNYDFSNKQELETFLGLEYNNCCYRVRLLARRWLDSNIANLVDDEDEDALYDSGVFFEIILKGLGSSGAKVDAILSDSIVGYREREQQMTH